MGILCTLYQVASWVGRVPFEGDQNSWFQVVHPFEIFRLVGKCGMGHPFVGRHSHCRWVCLEDVKGREVGGCFCWLMLIFWQLVEVNLPYILDLRFKMKGCTSGHGVFNKNDWDPSVSPVSPIQVQPTMESPAQVPTINIFPEATHVVDHLGRYWLYRLAWFAWKLGELSLPVLGVKNRWIRDSRRKNIVHVDWNFVILLSNYSSAHPLVQHIDLDAVHLISVDVFNSEGFAKHMQLQLSWTT